MPDRYLEMKDICKSFPGVKALQHVSFGMDEGEIVALVGENGAGKSTLMNVLGGVIKRDSGDIIINGRNVNIQNVADAQKANIAFIHQELSLFKELTVMENLFVDNFDSVRTAVPLFLSKSRMRKATEEVFDKLGIEVDPRAKVGTLPLGEQQMIEIATAVLKDAKIIILDEPTTSLAAKERDKLHGIMRQLQQSGKLIIYITHELENALMMSDRVVCLRDGQNAGEGLSKDMTKPDVVKMMIGSKAGKSFVKTSRDLSGAEPVLEFKDVRTTTKLNGASLRLRKGEVLGLYGLVGAGRTELIKAMYGLDKISGGEIYLDGKKLDRFDPKYLREQGIAWLTENRRDEGLFLEQPIDFNITIADIGAFAEGAFSFINESNEDRVAQESIEKLQIATPSSKQYAGKLSGGNQQKVVIAKWLFQNPRIFILDEPTRGIDVGAKDEIYRLIDDIANQGVSVLLISSEIAEIMGMSDRVVLMAGGRVAGELEGEDINNAKIIHYTMS